MFRTHLILLIECTLFLLVCSCGGQKGARSVDEIAANIVVAVPDSSVTATLKTITPDSLIFIREHSDERLSYVYDEARGQNLIFGTLNEGDRYAMLIEPSIKAILKIVNISQLSGQWFYDTEEQRGFTFTVAGALSSINPKDFSFRKWKFWNGKMILYYIDNETVARSAKEVKSDTTDIISLSDSQLEFIFRGEKLHCQRQNQNEAIKVKLKF